MMATRQVLTHPTDTIYESRPDGSLLMRLREPLGSYAGRVTEWLEHWAAATPDRVFLARRHGERWRTVSYAQALDAVCAIAQALLDRDLSIGRPVLILSGNGIEHGLLALAGLHAGVPFVPVSTAYSLVSRDSQNCARSSRQ
jgi:feruloyl-CoA synthase